LRLLLYDAGLLLTVALAAPYYLYKGLATGKYLSTFRERWGRPSSGGLNPSRERSIWVHAVSVGEVLAVRPLLAALRRDFPGLRLLLSTTTLSGQALARRTLAGDVEGIFFAPFDWPSAVRRVLGVVNPALLVLVETELWPNLIHQARARGSKIAVVNGRLSPRSFPRYRRLRWLIAPTLAEVDLFLMQADAHAERAIAIGAPAERVRVSGNLKYDGLGDGRLAPEAARLIGDQSRPLWIAGSTVEGEEGPVLEAFRALRGCSPAARLVIAPRHPERFDAVAAMVAGTEYRCVRRSALGEAAWSDGEVLLLDTIGDLAQLYAAATVVFVGGSLVPKGGHNVLEAAVAGRAVVVGPHMQNFREVASAFLAEDALVQIGKGEDLGPAVVALVRDEERRRAIGTRARAIVNRNQGAVERTRAALASLVS
jgi:3-deoxy-D-manno-octulosonic-acid transferase